MKGRNWLFIMALSSTLVFAGCTGNQKKKTEAEGTIKKEANIKDQIVNIDLYKSVVQWKGSLIGVYDHTGTLNFKSGTLTIENGKIVSGSFTVDMSTIMTTDENFNPEKGSTKEKLIGHLSSADFFDVENYPTAKFVITKNDGNMVKGELTIRGKTHEETVENIMIKEEGSELTITGDLSFDRQKYDVAWAHPMKDKVLMDAIELKIILK